MTEYVFLDTETTGLDDDAQVVEIAIVNQAGQVLFESYCKPTVPVGSRAQAVHGIGMDKLSIAPGWLEIADQVKAVLISKKVVIFNANFDIRVLMRTAIAQAYDLPDEDDFYAACIWIRDLDTYCAMQRAADVYGATNKYGTISLVNAAAAAGIKFQGRAHSAAGDAATTAALWARMCEVEPLN